MQVRQIKIVSSLLAIIASAAILSLRYFEPTPQVDRRPHEAVGEALAEQTAKLLGSGGRITLIAPDTVRYKYPATEIQLKAFQRALARAKLKVAATNLVRLDPLRLPRVSPGEFTDILRKQTDADVVVSFLGPAVLSPEQKARVGEKRPKVIAMCSGDMPRQIDLKALFAENLLQAAVVSRPKSGTLPQSDNWTAWFDNSFQWITPQNLADLDR